MAETSDQLPPEIRRNWYRQADDMEQQDEDENPLGWRVTWWRKRADEEQDPPPVEDPT